MRIIMAADDDNFIRQDRPGQFTDNIKGMRWGDRISDQHFGGRAVILDNTQAIQVV